MSLRWSEKDLAAHQVRRGAKVSMADGGAPTQCPPRNPPARSGGDSGQLFPGPRIMGHPSGRLESTDVPGTAPGGAPITIILHGEPVGKARARFRVAHRGDGTQFAAGYTPQKTRKYERALAAAGIAAMVGRPPLDGWLEITILAVMGVPRSWSARKRDAALAGVIRPGRPDWDNLAKIACDGLNTIAFRDDSQISHAVVEKRYGERPLIKIEIKMIGAFFDA